MVQHGIAPGQLQLRVSSSIRRRQELSGTLAKGKRKAASIFNLLASSLGAMACSRHVTSKLQGLKALRLELTSPSLSFPPPPPLA